MTWQPEMDELRRRQEMTKRMGGADKVKRQHDGGRLTVRERIDRLVDQDSFREIGSIAGKAEYDGKNDLVDLMPANAVMGRGKIDGRHVAVTGDDFTVRGGSADATIKEKDIFIERYANQYRVPLIRMIEGSGGGGSVKTIETTGRANVPGVKGWEWVVQNMGVVPTVGLGLGSVAGLGAARLAATHYSVMVKEISAMFVAGPPVVNSPEPQAVRQAGAGRLGDPAARRRDRRGGRQRGRGVCRHAPLPLLPALLGLRGAAARAGDGRSRQARGSAVRGHPARHPQGLSHPADHREDRRPGLLLRDGQALRPLGGDRLRAHRRLAGGGDGERPDVLWRRLDGRCLPEGGALRRHGRDLPSAGGLFLRLPRIPDRARGREERRHPPGRARHVGDVPDHDPVVHLHHPQRLRRGRGAHQNGARLNWRYAWPSGRWGSLPLEGGIEAAYRADIAAAPDPKAKMAEIEDRLNKLRSPFRSAETFWIEEIIDPRDTRKILCEFVELAAPVRGSGPEPPLDAALVFAGSAPLRGAHCGASDAPASEPAHDHAAGLEADIHKYDAPLETL